MQREFFVVLGVSKDADLNRVSSAYRGLVGQFVPRKARRAEPQGDQGEQGWSESGDAAVATQAQAEVAPARAQTRGRWSTVDDFFSGWVPGMFDTGRMASRHKDLYVELVLEPNEATAGGLFPLQVPVTGACRDCRGTGYQNGLSCGTCRGTSVGYHEAEISVPRGIPDGTRVRLSLGEIGLPGVDLIVLVTVRKS